MKLTAKQFKARTELDANWCAHLTEPIEVTEYLNMKGSKIKCLSPLITFSGRNKNGDCASFKNCKDLENTACTSHGFISFEGSGVKIIKDLHITQPNLQGFAADFDKCEFLEEATGKFPGAVTFSESGVRRIKNLEITAANEHGDAVAFYKCEFLEEATGKYPGFASFSECSGLKQTKNLEITHPNEEGASATFFRCTSKEITGKFAGYLDCQECSAEIINVTITEPDKDGDALSVEYCPNLRKVRGSINGTILGEKTIVEEYRNHLKRVSAAKIRTSEPELEP